MKLELFLDDMYWVFFVGMPGFLTKLVEAGNFISGVITFFYPEVVKQYEEHYKKTEARKTPS